MPYARYTAILRPTAGRLAMPNKRRDVSIWFVGTQTSGLWVPTSRVSLSAAIVAVQLLQSSDVVLPLLHRLVKTPLLLISWQSS
eukprot:COSAG02_NODE_44847_length_362_cov_0.973384_1_plen_83_part_01